MKDIMQVFHNGNKICTNMTNTWIFYGDSQDGIRTLHYIKECKRPEATKEYKEMMFLLENNAYHVTGYMTSKKWNEENQYIKVIQ